MPDPKHHTKILMLSQDPFGLQETRGILEGDKYTVLSAKDADLAIQLIIESSPDLVLLLWPGAQRDGLSLCRQLRIWFTGPIVVICSGKDWEGAVGALDAGADDYLFAPFQSAELLSRVRVQSHRLSHNRLARGVIRLGELHIDLARRQVIRGSTKIHFTRTEFEILSYLAEHLDSVVTSENILERVWGPFYRQYQQTLRVHIGHIRKKIEPDPSSPQYLVTETGVGYRLTLPNNLAAVETT